MAGTFHRREDFAELQEWLLRLPLAELAHSKEKVRAALNRATRKGERNVATANDGTFLYVWNETT